MFRTEMLSTFAFLLKKKGGFDESNPYIIGMRLPRYARNDILVVRNDNDILISRNDNDILVVRNDNKVGLMNQTHK